MTGVGGKKCVVGRRIQYRVHTHKEQNGTVDESQQNKWKEASVLAFGSRSGRHRLLYDEGDEVWVKLRDEDVHYLDDNVESKEMGGSPETGTETEQDRFSGKAAVGKRLRVYYGRKRMWLKGKVEEYNETTNKHLVSYCLGGTEWVTFSEEQVQWFENIIIDNVKNPKDDENNDCLNAAKIVIGRKMQMFLPERNEWMDGEIWEFSLRTNRYHIVFDDDQDLWANLKDEKVKWDPITQRALSKRKLTTVESIKKEKKRHVFDEIRGDLKMHSSPKKETEEKIDTVHDYELVQTKNEKSMHTPPSLLYSGRMTEQPTGMNDSNKVQKKEENINSIPEDPSPSVSCDAGRPSRSGRTNAALGSAGVGRRIRIYWKDDMKWYTGRILDFNPVSRCSLVKYDDSEKEWLLLGREQVEWLKEDRDATPTITAQQTNRTATVVTGKIETNDQDVVVEYRDLSSVEEALAKKSPQNFLAKSSEEVPKQINETSKDNLKGASDRRTKQSEYPNTSTPPAAYKFTAGPNAVKIFLPLDFEMASVVLRSSESGGERAKLLHRMKILDRMIERVTAAEEATKNSE